MTHPTKRNVLGIMVDAIEYEAAIDRVLAAVHARKPFGATALAVHGVAVGHREPAIGQRINELDLVAPDGQPVRWALNLLSRAGLAERVYGPNLMLRLLDRCASEGLPVFLYGSTPAVLGDLTNRLQETFPSLLILGAEASKFRDVGDDELQSIAERIIGSGARLVFVGLGCPRQELFVHAMRTRLSIPLVAVGAAYDFHAGRLEQAPPWMQRHGLEWLFRLSREPRRLWRRYVVLNPYFVAQLVRQRLGADMQLGPATETPRVIPA